MDSVPQRIIPPPGLELRLRSQPHRRNVLENGEIRHHHGPTPLDKPESDREDSTMRRVRNASHPRSTECPGEAGQAATIS